MTRRPLMLVRSERQVERALASGAHAVTFRAFVGRWASAVGRPATPESALLATALAAQALAGELKWTADLSLAQALDAALGPLRRAGVGSAALASLPHPRARLMARVLEASDAHLARANLFDERAGGWKAAQALDEASLHALPSRVVVDGLAQWDAGTCAWVEALARRLPVVVRLPRSSDRRCVELARAVDVLLSALESRWQHLSNAPDLELYDIALPDQVRLIEAASETAEARAIVRVVAEQLARGASAERVAVLLPALDEALLEPLRAAFDEAQIAFAEPRGRPPRAAPAVDAALAWLDLLSAPLHRNGLMALLEADAVDPAPFIEGAQLSARRQRALALVRRLARMPVGSDPEGALMLDMMRGHLEQRPHDGWMLQSLERLVALVRAGQVDAPRQVLLEQLVATWTAMGLGVTDLAHVAAWAHASSHTTAQRLERSLHERSAAMRALLGAGERVLEAARALGVAEQPLPPAPGLSRPGCVRLVRASDVAGLVSEVLIVTRASEGAFLDIPPDGSLLGDEVRVACPPSRRPTGAADRAAAARTELLLAMAGAQQLVLTRSCADEEGRPLAVATLFAQLASEHPPEKEPASLFQSEGSALSDRAQVLIGLGRGGAVGDVDVARRVAIELERAQFFADPLVAPGEASGRMTLNDVAARHLQLAVGGTPERPIAATLIERAAQCRFAAFATRVLGAGGEDELGEGLQPWQRGSLIHRGLHAAFEAVGAIWDQLARDELIARANAAAQGALLGGKTSLLYRAEVERALRDVAAVVVWSLDDASGFRFAYGERAFGEALPAGARPRGKTRAEASAPPWPALVVGEGALRIRVKGRIDRVDLTRDGTRARVLDYKSGALPAWKDVGTVWFQPALYALAVWQQLGRLSVSEVRALYLDTSRRPPRTLPAEKSQVIGIQQIADADRGAAAIVGKLWRGDVAPRPWHASVCTRCAVRDVCRRPAAMPIEELEPESDAP